MKVAVFAEYLPPRLGSDRRIFEIMKRLSSKHEVHFVVFPPFRELRDRSVENRRKSLSQDGYSTVKFENIKGHLISVSPRVALLWQRSLLVGYCLTALFVFLKSIRTMRTVNSDIVVLNYPSPYTGLLGFLEAKLWNKPVIVDFNDLIAQYTGALLNLKKGSFAAKLLVLVQNYIVKNADWVVTPTRLIKKYATALGIPERKIRIISNGVDTKMFCSSRFNCFELRNDLHLENEKICVYCGRLDGWAGMNIMRKICETAKMRGLAAKFLLVGSGEGKTLHGENIISLGEVPYEKVPSVLAIADVILIPFPDNEVSHAASPLKLFEGMAMQKPIIASKVSGIEEVVLDGDNGFLVDPNDLHGWIYKLEMVLNTGTLASTMGQKAKRTVEERFDWTVLAQRFEEVLNVACPKWKE